MLPLEFDSSQEKFLGILPMISGFLSLLGSGWIIVEVLTTKAKLYTVYNRLLLAMSIVDVMASIGYMFSTIPIPKGSYEVVWAFGTVQTCTAQGFFVQLGLVPAICKSQKQRSRVGAVEDCVMHYASCIHHPSSIMRQARIKSIQCGTFLFLFLFHFALNHKDLI